jgi:hypothetical protein
VQWFDALFLRSSIGSGQGQPGYNPRYDLDTNGWIQGLDTLFIRLYIGQFCSNP